jgi:hypothetical protein
VPASRSDKGEAHVQDYFKILIVMLMELEGLQWSEIYSDIRRATLRRNF